jgi:hypothetical protein
VVNLKTAKTVEVENGLLLRAGKVVEQSFCCRALCPFLAQSGHPRAPNQCLLLGVKRTSIGRAAMSAF